MAENTGAIDSISIEIGASSKNATRTIKNLTNTLKDMKEALSGENGSTFKKLKQFADALSGLKGLGEIKLNNKLPEQIRNIGKAVSEVSDDTVRRLGEMTAAIERLRGIDLKGFSSAVKAAKKASNQMTALQNVGKPGEMTPPPTALVNAGNAVSDADITKMFDRDFGTGKEPLTGNLLSQIQEAGRALKATVVPAMKSVAEYAKTAAKSFLSFAGKKIKNIWDKSAFAGLEKSLGRIKHVIASFERIAFYRAIRSAIKYVTDALKEGVENAYHYADEFGTATHYIAEAYDRISGSNFTMSNQLGAAWATMIAYIEPIIIRLINLVTRAADAITQFFALLSGKGTYLKAVDYNKKWADSATGAAKAAKEWRNQLMGFDEINRLEEPSDGSGGGGGANTPDYSGMFQEMPVNDFFAEIRKAFENGEWAKLGTLLGQKFNEIVDSIKWAEYGQKIGRGLQNSITVAYTFLKTADFKNLGGRISEFVNNAIEQVNFKRLGRLWMRLRTALWDVIYGAVTKLNWKTVAEKLSDFVLGALNELSNWISSLEPTEIANALKDFFGNIKYTEIGEALYDLLKSAVDFAVGILDELGLDGKTVKAIFEIVAGLTALILAIKGITTVVGAVKIAIGLLTSPIGLVIVGITALVAAGVLLYKNWDTIKETAEKVFGPLLHDIKKIFDGIKEVFSGLIDFVAGVFTGNWSRAWDGVKQVFSGVVDIVIGNIQIMFDWIRGLISAVAEGIAWLQGLWDSMNQIAERNARWNEETGNLYATDPSQLIPRRAGGGMVEDGLFYANHGEIVGQFSNGRTAVANNEMIVEGISAGVFNAVVSAFSQTGGGGDDRPINIYMDGKQIAQSTTKYQTQFARASGA